MEKLFKIQDSDGNPAAGMGDIPVALGNAYVTAYGKLVRGKPPGELGVDEFCVKEYALSGQKATEYWILRVQ